MTQDKMTKNSMKGIHIKVKQININLFLDIYRLISGLIIHIDSQ